MIDVRQGQGRFGSQITPRERFNRTMHYQHVDYISHLEFGYWTELKEDWMQQGHLPRSFHQRDGSIPDRLVEEYFGVEQFEMFRPRIGALPLRTIQVVKQTDHTPTTLSLIEMAWACCGRNRPLARRPFPNSSIFPSATGLPGRHFATSSSMSITQTAPSPRASCVPERR